MTETTAASDDAMYGLLADARRQRILSNLIDGGSIGVEDLCRRIAASEAGTTPETVAEDRCRAVHISLVHNHLPRLEDHGVVDYDADAGDITPAAALDDVRQFVDEIDETDGPEAIEPSFALFPAT